MSRHVLEIDRDASIHLLPYSKLYVQTKSGTYSHVRVFVCLIVCLWTSSSDRVASIDLLPYSELYVQPGPGTYSHVRVPVCLSLSVCGQVPEIETPALICCLTANYMYGMGQVLIATSVRLSVCLSVCGQVPEIETPT